MSPIFDLSTSASLQRRLENPHLRRWDFRHRPTFFALVETSQNNVERRRRYFTLVTQPRAFLQSSGYPSHSQNVGGSQCGPISDIHEIDPPFPNDPAAAMTVN